MVKFGEHDIQHWVCSSCGKEITYIKDEAIGWIGHATHFDIERSIKELWLKNGDIEENIETRNVKMQRFLCEECFLKILNESPTLGKLFYNPTFNKFIY